MQDLKICVIQSDLVWENVPANLEAFDAKLLQINEDVDLIVLPEVFNTGFPVDPEKFAETINGSSVNWMRKKAKLYNAVVTGSLLVNENGKFYNTLIWMQANGEFQTYSKRHVFHLGDEADTINPGTKQLVCSLNEWNIKPLICYDLRFPVWSKNTFANNKFEYDVLIYVANWPASRSYPWKQLLIARALENQSYVIGVNRIGKDEVGNAYSGDTMIIDPKGQIIANVKPNKEASIVFSLSAKMITDFRNKFNVGYDWDRFEIV
jgi:predicted amidohydrolase